MMILNFRSCLCISLILHFMACIILSVITNNFGIRKPFIVFGAHSKKNYHTIYKSGQLNKKSGSTVPFIDSGKFRGKKSGIGSGKKSKTRRHRGKNHPSSGSKNPKVSSKSYQSGKFANLKTNAAKTHIPKTRMAKQKRQISKSSKTITKSRSTTKQSPSNIRPVIPEISGKKKNPEAAKIKKQKEEESIQKLKLEADLQKYRQVNKLADLNKETKKNIEKDQAPEKLENLAPKTTSKATKVDSKVTSKPKPDEPPNKILAENSIQNETANFDEEDISEDDQAFDTNETSSTLILSLNGKVDAKTTMYQRCIQQEVERLWKPPLGVPKNTTCRIGFWVDRKGKVKNFEITKRSSVLIYDLSILRIAHLFKFDKKLWGKSFSIDFCQ